MFVAIATSTLVTKEGFSKILTLVIAELQCLHTLDSPFFLGGEGMSGGGWSV